MVVDDNKLVVSIYLCLLFDLMICFVFASCESKDSDVSMIRSGDYLRAS